jgi:pilus assembly protein CpaB
MRRPRPARRLDVALALRRRPRHRQVLVIVLALLAGFATMGVVQRAEDAAAAWGTSVPVLVATRDLAPGEPLDATSSHIEPRPGPLVPDDALHARQDDVRVAEAIYAGDIVRAARLAPAGLSAVAARLPAGTRAMAVPVEPGLVPTLTVGDRVDVLVALAPEAAGGGPPGFVLAAAAPVVDVDDAAVTIAVPADAAPRLAVAFGAGAVTLALTADQRTA